MASQHQEGPHVCLFFTPPKCAKPVLKKGCGTALVMSITAVTPVGGACAQLAYYESRVFVCATSTELVGITSDPERTDYSSIYIEGRSLKLSGPGTYPLPIGGRIDTFLATGSIRCRPIDPDGALSV